jgi:hypothetical protein
VEVKTMDVIRVTGRIDDRHLLSAEVPDSIPPGPVTVLIVPGLQEDDAGQAWTAGVAGEWADELGDARQDIYTLADGEPVGES